MADGIDILQLLIQDILKALSLLLLTAGLGCSHRLRSKKLMVKAHKIMYGHVHLASSSLRSIFTFAHVCSWLSSINPSFPSPNSFLYFFSQILLIGSKKSLRTGNPAGGWYKYASFRLAQSRPGSFVQLRKLVCGHPEAHRADILLRMPHFGSPGNRDYGIAMIMGQPV